MNMLATRANASRVALMVVIVFLLLAAARQATTAGPARPAVAMSAECHEAYRGYMDAADEAEADFWADSWMTFGCETGGGYWA